jgi:transcriptional regulator with XRE-family HTH domain
MPSKKADFKQLLIRWNKGIKRGSQLRLAKLLGVQETTVSRWVKGNLMPGEEHQKRIAKELGLTPEELMDSLKPLGYRDTQEQILLAMLKPKEQEILKELCEQGTRGPIEAIRQLLLDVGAGRLVPAGSPRNLSDPIDDIGHVQRRQYESAEPMPHPKASESK